MKRRERETQVFGQTVTSIFDTMKRSRDRAFWPVKTNALKSFSSTAATDSFALFFALSCVFLFDRPNVGRKGDESLF